MTIMERQTITIAQLKRGLLVFWAAWFTLVLATNSLDGLKAMGALPSAWPLASGNLKLIGDTTAVLGVPGWLNGLLFVGVILWEALAAALLWRAAAEFGEGIDLTSAYPAFAVSIALWAAFLLADELFVAYSMEAPHFRPLIAELATLILLQLPPRNAA